MLYVFISIMQINKMQKKEARKETEFKILIKTILTVPIEIFSKTFFCLIKNIYLKKQHELKYNF